DHDPVVAIFNLPLQDSLTALSSSLNPSVFGQSVTFTATVTGNGSAVTQGSVTFKEGVTVLAGPTALNASGQAFFSTSNLSAGSHTITAEYSGSTNFSPSSGSVSQTVTSTPGISISDASVTEGNAGTTNAVFTVSLSVASG